MHAELISFRLERVEKPPLEAKKTMISWLGGGGIERVGIVPGLAHHGQYVEANVTDIYGYIYTVYSTKNSEMP